jgi:hypothetical protein
LVNIAKNAKDPDIRTEAINKISDQKILADIFINAKYSDVRIKAINKISDQKVLVDIVINAKYSDVCIAISKLSNQNLLIIIETTNNQKVLGNIVKCTENSNVRHEAFIKISDQDVLGDIAINAKDPDIRLDATNKIIDQKVLGKVVINIKNSNNPKDLINYHGLIIRHIAFDKITD